MNRSRPLPLLALLAALCPAARAQEARLLPAATPPAAETPAAADACLAGAEDCTLVPGRKPGPGAMDAATEGVLIGMGAASSAQAAASAAAAQQRIQTVAASAPVSPAPEKTPAYDDETDYAGIGSKIINPAGATAVAAAPRAPAQAPARAPAVFTGRVDDSPSAPKTFTKATGLSYIRNQKVEALAGDRGSGLGTLVNDYKSGVSDPKLSGANVELAPGGTRASANTGN